MEQGPNKQDPEKPNRLRRLAAWLGGRATKGEAAAGFAEQAHSNVTIGALTVGDKNYTVITETAKSAVRLPMSDLLPDDGDGMTALHTRRRMVGSTLYPETFTVLAASNKYDTNGLGSSDGIVGNSLENSPIQARKVEFYNDIDGPKVGDSTDIATIFRPGAKEFDLEPGAQLIRIIPAEALNQSIYERNLDAMMRTPTPKAEELAKLYTVLEALAGSSDE